MRRNGTIRSIHPDPLLAVADRLEADAEEKAEAGDTYGASLCRIHAKWIREACADLVNRAVPYKDTEELTGHPKGSILNMKDESGNRACPNVGTGNAGAFRLGDLPFKPGHGSPAKARLAAERLQQHWTGKRASARERRVRGEARRAS